METMKTTLLTHEELFEIKIHRIGRFTILLCIILALAVPGLLWISYGIIPPLRNLLSGIVTVSSFMIPLSIAEIFAFYPILGSSGTYMAYTTGNIANLKVPSAAIGMEVAEVKPGTKEGDIISTIAMAGSVVVCEIILLMGMLMIVPLSVKLSNPVLKPAFEQILPALFGALGAYYIIKDWKLAVIPMIVGIIFAYIGNVPTAVTIPLCVLSSILGARYLYKVKP